MVTMEEIAKVVNNYAPRLDEVEKVKFSMFIHNQFAKEENLNDLNLANEWNRFVSDVFTCLDCYSHFNKNEGILTDNQGHQEFICNPCSTKSACEMCGTWTENHATIFWNCLCKECWEAEKERE